MRTTIPIAAALVALSAIASTGCQSRCACEKAASPTARAGAPAPTVKYVRLAVSPPDVDVSIQGEKVEHPLGYVDLPGIVGYAMEIELRAGTERTVKRVVVTDGGADPAQIALVVPTKPAYAADPEVDDLLRRSEPPPAPPSSPAGDPSKKGRVAVSSFPPARVAEGGVVLCAVTPCFFELSHGPHDLRLTGPKGQKRTLRIDVRGGQTTAVPIQWSDPSAADPLADALR